MGVLFIVLSIVLTLVIILVVRTVQFKPEILNQEKKHHPYKYDCAYKRLQKLIQIPTISNRNIEKVDLKEVSKVEELLEKEYPSIHKHCNKKKIGGTGLLFHYKGKDSKDPTVLMAHYNVALQGMKENGELWGGE